MGRAANIVLNNKAHDSLVESSHIVVGSIFDFRLL